MTEQGCSDKIVVQRRNGLTRVNIAKFHERRLILGFQDKRNTEIILIGLSVGPMIQR
jgi:hypothetical protein